ncbi:MAG: hypothetical protein ABI539_00575 [Acidobacteriota bacterium]
MKKFLVSAIFFVMIGVGLPLSVEAQRSCPRNRRVSRNYSSRTYRTAPRYYTTSYSTQRRPSFYRRHRNVINMAIGTGAGLLIGGLVGGRRGAGIGALTGLGGSALYTYGLNPKKRRYYRRY